MTIQSPAAEGSCPEGFGWPKEKEMDAPLDVRWRRTVRLGSFWRDTDDTMLDGYGAWVGANAMDKTLVAQTPLPSSVASESFEKSYDMVERDKQGSVTVKVNLLFFKIKFHFGASVHQSTLKYDVSASRKFQRLVCVKEPTREAYEHINRTHVEEALKAGATHMVVGVEYGHRVYVEIKDSVDMHEAFAEVRAGNFVERLGSKAIVSILEGLGEQGRSRSFKDRSVKYAGDIVFPPGGNAIPPLTVDQAWLFTEHVQTHIENSLSQTLDGIGVPQHVRLLPLRDVLDKSGLEVPEHLRPTWIPQVETEMKAVTKLSERALNSLTMFKTMERDPATLLVKSMYDALKKLAEQVKTEVQDAVLRLELLVAASRVDVARHEELRKITFDFEESLDKRRDDVNDLNITLKRLHDITDPKGGLFMETWGSPHVPSVDVQRMLNPSEDRRGALVMVWSMDSVRRILSMTTVRVVLLLRLSAPFDTSPTNVALETIRNYVKINAENKYTLGVVVVENVTSKSPPPPLLTIHHFIYQSPVSTMKPPTAAAPPERIRVVGRPRVEELFAPPCIPTDVAVDAVERHSFVLTWNIQRPSFAYQSGYEDLMPKECVVTIERVVAEGINGESTDDVAGEDEGIKKTEYRVSAKEARENARQLQKLVGGDDAAEWGILVSGLEPMSGYVVSVQAMDLHGCGGSDLVSWDDATPVETREPPFDTFEHIVTGHEVPAGATGTIEEMGEVGAPVGDKDPRSPLQLVVGEDISETFKTLKVINLNLLERRMLLDLNPSLGLRPDFSASDIRALASKKLILDEALAVEVKVPKPPDDESDKEADERMVGDESIGDESDIEDANP